MVCGWGFNIGDLGKLEPLSYRTYRTRLERLPLRFFDFQWRPSSNCLETTFEVGKNVACRFDSDR